MTRLAIVALLCAACRGAETEEPTDWWGDHPEPDTFCGAHRDAVAASAGCEEGHADDAFGACLEAYRDAYDEGCIDAYAALLPCLDAEAAYTCDEAGITDPPACAAEQEAYEDCATAFTTYSPT